MKCNEPRKVAVALRNAARENARMAISATVNGKTLELPREMTVAQFLAERGLAGRRLAVARNGDIVETAEYDASTIKDGDVLEVVRLVGGG